MQKSEFHKQHTKIVFITRLLKWWGKNKEHFAFRETSDPYKILITEMLLRKTQRKQVDLIYSDFFEKFPDPSSVTDSSPEQIRKIVAPLGLHSRVRDIFEACSEICRKYDGTVPSTEKELRGLPGVGSYIAAVIMTLGFKNPRPMIDSNVKRVFSRVFGIFTDSDRPFNRIQKEYLLHLPLNKETEFHFAIMDLAHQTCKSAKPLCSKCPLENLCQYANR